MRLLVKNIGKIVGIETAGRLRLCGGEMDRLETLDDAWLLADDGRIAAFGRMETLGEMAADRTVDAEGGMLFPSFCDSHTHLVYAGSREQEFLDKINGLSYEEIARRGGGILNSADLLHETSEEELYAQAMERVREIAAKGTGCVEIKSGYGLTTGLGVALASDYNPGSSPSGDMRMVVSLACIRMKMTPAEAINAATLNGAYAMGLSRSYGSVTVGKVANFFITKPIPSVEFLPYAYTTPLIRRVFLRGEEYVA